MNIYIGNLSYNISEEELESAFGEYGQVTTTNIIKDRETGRSKGFAFVEMPNDSDAETAISNINGKPLAGRPVKVNQAKPRERRPQQRRPSY